MFRIRGTQDIYISKGDTANVGFNLVVNGDNGFEDYEMVDREYIIFKLWDKEYKSVLATTQSELGSSIIKLADEITQNCGEYRYSADLIYANGMKETVAGKNPNTAPRFIVMEA